MAKNSAKTATKATERRVIDPALKGMENHFAEVTGGRKIAEGTKVEVRNVYVNRYGVDTARIVINGEAGFINPKFLKKGKPLPAATVAVIEAEREEAERPVLLLCKVRKVNMDDDGNAKSVTLAYPGWYRPITFGVGQVERIADELGDDGEMSLYEVPAWKIKQGAGQDSLDVIEGHEKEWRQLVK